MFTLNEIITFEYENEHVFDHNLQLKKQFSKPKIYIANGDLTKRWYVYFSYRNPKSGKLERLKNIYGKTNTYKTKEQRLSVLTTYRKRLLLHLKDGYNPFEDNTEHYQSKSTVNTNAKPKPDINPKAVPKTVETQTKEVQTQEAEPKMTLKEAFDFSLKLKESIVQPRTLADYKNKTKLFLE